MTGHDPYEVIVTRRPTPEAPPPFVCAICCRTIEADPWLDVKRYPTAHKPPVCASCSHHWGMHTKLRNITRGDDAALHRLVAVTEALNWEAHNGRYSKHGFAAR